ncbi:MAG: GH3 auxin-responsive promoter family protein [Pseudomonadales bacterium]
MSLFVKLFLSGVSSRTINRFREQCKDPQQVQRELLAELIAKNRYTRFGKDHGFKNITSFGHFQRDVPITTYEDIWPYVERSLKGEPAQLTAEQPVFFAMTSGTTGKPKYIPVTPENRSAKSQLMRVWLCQINRDHPNAFADRVLTIVSPEDEEYSPSGIPCGAESGHGYKNMPNSLKATYSCPYEVYAVRDYESKYYTMLRTAAGQSISLLYTPNPSAVLLLAKRLGEHSERIIRDVRDGTLSADFDVPGELRNVILSSTRPDPKRAKFLEQAASKHGGMLLPKHIWPRLSVICSWKGGSVSEYLPKFSEYFPANIGIRDIGFFASEMRGSVPLSDEGDSGVLAIPTNVFEFFPADINRKPDRLDLLTVDQLEEGRNYYIYVTTSGGLCRYDMNDIIRITGFYEQTPLMRFVQKGKGVVSFTGEKLYESQVVDAVAYTFAPFKRSYEFIAAVGSMKDSNPRYTFLVEFKDEIAKAEGEDIINNIDQKLAALNIEYEAKRKSKRIDPPVLRVVRWGELDRFRKRSVEGGKSDAQFKILRLTQDASFLNEFASECEITATA